MSAHQSLHFLRRSVGVPQKELPFDVQGFLAEIEKQNQ